MTFRLRRIVLSTAIALALATLGAHAQQTGFKRTPIQQTDLSIPGKEVVQAVAEISPGAESGRHTHPGEEVAYIIEGAISLEIQGKPAVIKKAGEGFVVPPGVVHNAKHSGTGQARVLATYIIDKGKPAATPVQ